MIKVTDVAYGRLRAPDLDQMETFLTDFGLIRAERTSSALYVRGTDADRHIHITELGEPCFLGIAFNVADGDDLERLSRLGGATPVETMDAPGAGRRVRLTDPNGIGIEVVHGIAGLEPLPVRANVMNTGDARLSRSGIGNQRRL